MLWLEFKLTFNQQGRRGDGREMGRGDFWVLGGEGGGAGYRVQVRR